MLLTANTSPTEPNPLPSRRARSALSAFLSNPLIDKRHQLLLITEDETTEQRIQSEFGTEMRISRTSKIRDGIDHLKKDCPEMIICDHRTEVESLIEAIKQAEFCHIPVLLMTSEKDQQSCLTFLGQGCVDLLRTPYETVELRTRMENYLQISLAKKLLKTELQIEEASLVKMAEDASHKVKELRKLNRTKDDFLAMLSHELRNPINVISGFAEVLVENASDAELAFEAAQTIYRNAQFQAKLVQDLMDVSRSMNGKLHLECRPLELDHIVEEILPEVETAAQKKSINLCVKAKCAGLISGDFTRIRQVIWNLLSNAIKFTPEGGKIDLEIRRKGTWVELMVKDSGVGIDSIFLPHIFEQFHQQDASITRRFGGLGLGLTIVKNIVELHKGKIQAHSDGVGMGSTFIVQLPALPN